MKLCAVSFRETWQDADGRWRTGGGFPLQMAAVGSLFSSMELVLLRGDPERGGLPLPAHARVVRLRRPVGQDLRRKLDVLLWLPYYVTMLTRHIRRADVVHVPLPGDMPLLALMLALLWRKRVVARYGGSWQTNSQTTSVEKLTRWLLRRCAGGRNVVLATGQDATPPAPGVRWIFATAVSRRELDAAVPELDRPLGAPPHLVFVGRLSPEKGLPLLVRAVAELAGGDRSMAPRLTLIGDGPERGRLETLVRELGCGDLVDLTGQLDRTALGARLARADLCVQPSLTEGFSKAWLDAMAYGVPLIASHIGAARAVVGDDGERGWLVPAGDAVALLAALRRALAGDLDLPAMRRRCRDYAEAHTLEQWADEIGRHCSEQWATPIAPLRPAFP